VPVRRFECADKFERLTEKRQSRRQKEKEEFMKKLLLAIFICFIIYGIASAAVNINTATKAELTTLQGIGEKRAQDIIDFRTKNGPFKSIDDLEKVPGIGPGKMKLIRSQLSVTGKTTIDKPAGAPARAVDTKKTAAKGDAMKAEKKAADTKPAKTGETKKTEPAKGDVTKADPAKEKTAAKPKADDKAAPKAEDKKAEQK
jgi:competence protein ComEA